MSEDPFLLELQAANDSDLSDLAARIAVGTMIDHELARQRGETVEGPEDLQWANEQLRELGLLTKEQCFGPLPSESTNVQ